MNPSSGENPPKLTVHSFSGPVSGAELRKVAMGFLRDAPTPLVLWDFLEADLSGLSTQDLVALFDAMLPFVQHRKGGRSAYVSNSAVGFGLGRLCEALAEVRDYPFEVKAFTNCEDARRWLEMAPNGLNGSEGAA